MTDPIAPPLRVRRVRFQIPGYARGKARPRHIPGQVRPFTPAKTVGYEKTIANAGKEVWPFAPTSNAIMLIITVMVMPTESWPRWKHALIASGQLRPVAKPDLDNIEKAVSDGLNGVIWRDDVQITECRKVRKWSDSPGVFVEVIELDGYPSNIKQDPSK
jgi:Holliday junction resolvase RusA-like endonuclease